MRVRIFDVAASGGRRMFSCALGDCGDCGSWRLERPDPCGEDPEAFRFRLCWCPCHRHSALFAIHMEV